MKRLRGLWATYRERVIPPDAPPLQVVECRRAFYAGAESLLRAVMTDLDPGHEPTDADLQRMDAIESELKEFRRGRQGGSRMSTHTYAVLEVSPGAYREIRALLEAAGYEHAFHRTTHEVVRDGEREGEIEVELIDMHGIALGEGPRERVKRRRSR